jgi:peptide/nickel transport system substrate-binding protein
MRSSDNSMGIDDTDITADELSGPVVDSETTKKILGKVDRRTVLRFLGAAGMTGLAGCAGDTGGEENATQGDGKSAGPKGDRYGGRLQAGWKTPKVTKLDPVLAPQGFQLQITRNIMGHLVGTTSDLKVYGSLAEDWSTDDAQTWTWKLVEDAKWQKGYGKVTAQDWENTYKRAMTVEGSVDKSTYSQIKGQPGDGGIEIINDYKLRLHLEEPNVGALILFGILGWTNKQAVEDLGRQTHNTKPVGCGPYKITEHETGQRITLDRFDDYHQTDKDVPFVESRGDPLPFLDGIDISMIPEATTLINALRRGSIQFVNNLPRQNVPKAKKIDDAMVTAPPPAGFQTLCMNTLREPFGNNGVFKENSKYHKTRLGIAKSINKKEVNQQAFLGQLHPAIGPIPPGHPEYFRKNKPDYQAYAPEEGRQLLEEAGSLNANVNFLTNKNNLRRSKVVKNQLDDVLNISLSSVPRSVFLNRLDKAKFDMTIQGAGADISMLDWLYETFRPPNNHPNAPEGVGGGLYNRTMLYHPTISKNAAKVRTITDEEKRTELMQKTEDLMMKSGFSAFLFHTVFYQALAKEVQGYPPHIQDRNFVSTWIKE